MRRARAVHRWHGVVARHKPPAPVSQTRTQRERVDPQRGDPRMHRVREHRPPIDCIIIIPALPPQPVPGTARVIRCPARTTDPSFRFRSAYLPHSDTVHRSLRSIHAARMPTRLLRVEFGGRGSVCTVDRDFIIGRCNVDWQPFRRCMGWHLRSS